MLHAVGELPAEHLAYPVLHVVDGQVADAVGPDRDAFEEGAGDVGAGLTYGEYGVEVDVGFDEGWGDEAAAKVDSFPGDLSGILDESPSVHRQIPA
ncbi:hypothetical protein GCM10010435_87090 [Winogradskya consettensis]|uniref:Uncharacterized protein n=1 Tax=Winogradskya consettensis TaxID=113560 RepID=A0A919SY26_9ACTN|nr:hypothetical protein Aco04nite_73340 [Actinoplanes consettensis]